MLNNDNAGKDEDRDLSHITLPPFIDFPIPEKEYYTIVDDGITYRIEETNEEFKDATAAYDHIRENLKGQPIFGNLERAGNIVGGMLFSSSDNRLLLSHTRKDDIWLLKDSYEQFLELTKRYKGNPDDWYTAYQWVAAHPAFYHRYEINLNNWETDAGWDDHRASVYRDERGDTQVLIEHGPWEDNHTVHTIDHRLDSSGHIFEEAFVNFAKKVDEHYDLNGESIDEPEITVDLPTIVAP